jgi:hypothetical protein|tara:strand:+ start:1119 stop:1256 length:138 start_codon:yes stop_codon:yes gene_type:complete
MKKVKIRKRIISKAISFLSMFLSAEDAKELFDELREIAKKHGRHS